MNLAELYASLISSNVLNKDINSAASLQVNLDLLDADGNRSISKEEFVVATIGKDLLYDRKILAFGFN